MAGAMITTAGVVFSLTVVSLQLASSQFSPRVMRSFIRGRLSQVVIGLLVATFTYCVLTLRHVDEESSRDAPALSLTTAVVVTVVTVVTVLLIIAHLNHLAGRLQVDQLRQSAGSQTQVLAALMRALRMLHAHAEEVGRPERAAAFAEQLDLVVASVEHLALAPADRERLLSMRADRTDPADHLA